MIGFSDIQANLAAKLIKAHLPVVIFNQRSIEDILDVVFCHRSSGGAEDKGMTLLETYQQNLDDARLLPRLFIGQPYILRSGMNR